MIVGILLAAGESRRFGSRKLLHPLADGVCIGVRSAQNLRRGVDKVVAVIAPGDGALQNALAGAGVEICVCPRSQEGMGASLACGVRAAAGAEGWIVALADMPFVRFETIAALAQSLRAGAPLAAPVYRERRGNPVGFRQEYYAELVALAGDVGAKGILQRDRTRAVLVPVEDPGIQLDIDTPGDLMTPPVQPV